MAQREMSGAIFREQEKKSERAPDYTGSCLINGQELRIAGWIKEGRSGKFMSLAFSEPRNHQQGGGGSVVDEAADFF